MNEILVDIRLVVLVKVYSIAVEENRLVFRDDTEVY